MTGSNPHPLVIVHGRCSDGFGAAFAAWKRFGPQVEVFFAIHGEEGNHTLPKDWGGRDVYILDFCYPPEVLMEMATTARRVVVLDHHKTAMESCLHLLDELSPGYYEGGDENLSLSLVFDMHRSGAGIAWDYFNGDDSRPWIINYVEDRDLWNWKLENSAEVNEYIRSIPNLFEAWDKAADVDLEVAVDRGHWMLQVKNSYVRAMMEMAKVGTFDGHPEVPVVNAPFWSCSELVGKLAEKSEAKFAVGWWMRPDGKFQYSLRSRSGFDVSELAKKYGGGGHAGAAGFIASAPVHESRGCSRCAKLK